MPVNDNYKEINLESEKMEIYGHWFNMKNLLSLRKSVSGSYPTSNKYTIFTFSHLFEIFSDESLDSHLWSKVVNWKAMEFKYIAYQIHLKWDFRNKITS